VEDQRPDEAKDHLWFFIHNVCFVDIEQSNCNTASFGRSQVTAFYEVLNLSTWGKYKLHVLYCHYLHECMRQKQTSQKKQSITLKNRASMVGGNTY